LKDGFWSRIAGINAQFYGAVALLFLLIAIFWALRPEYSGVIEIENPRDSELRTRQTPPDSGPSAAAGLRGISASPEASPFSSEYLRRVNAQLSWAEQAASALRAAASAEAAAPAEDDTPAVAASEEQEQSAPADTAAGETPAEGDAAPPAARVLGIVYRGMITNLDGESLGLVENLETGISSYYAIGAEIEWARIAAFSRETMRIEAGGEEHVLRRGLPCLLEEGPADER
jgi:hypothetical protein